MNEYFGKLNPQYWVETYYGELINKIDIFVEVEIETATKKNEPESKKVDYYNQLRNTFLSEIKAVEIDNLKQIKSNLHEIQQKIKSIDVNNTHAFIRCSEEIKSQLVFKRFCFLIQNKSQNLIYLVSTDFYVTEKEIEFLKTP